MSRTHLTLPLLWLLLALLLLGSQLPFPAPVVVQWQTATELNTAGFQLYRRAEDSHEFRRISDSLIVSTGSSNSGARYEFVDTNIRSGQTYHYLLEEVELDGSQHRFETELITHTVPWLDGWRTLLAAVSFLLAFISYQKVRQRPFINQP